MSKKVQRKISQIVILYSAAPLSFSRVPAVHANAPIPAAWRQVHYFLSGLPVNQFQPKCFDFL